MKNNRNRIDQSVQFLTETGNVEQIQAKQLKLALVKRLSAEHLDVEPRLIYQAVNEANALASLTIVPLLVLPTLAEEKVQKVAAWAAHQRSVLHSDSFAFAA
jgi:hypothetical protein